MPDNSVPFSVVFRTTTQYINKEIEDVNNSVNQPGLAEIAIQHVTQIGRAHV